MADDLTSRVREALEALGNLARPATHHQIAEECISVWPELENHRANVRSSDPAAVLAGELEPFALAWLRRERERA